MKATQSIPVNESEKEIVRPEVRANGPTRADSIFAMIRRIDAELKSMKLDVTNLRRDVNRIERKQNRELESPVNKQDLAATAAFPGGIGRECRLPDPFLR